MNLRTPLAGAVPLTSVLDQMTREGELYMRLPGGSVQCHACAHRCRIRPGGRGVCQVRFNQGGALHVPWGYVAALNADPIEKKPFYHVFPGTTTLTFGMLGCDMHCPYCQNWNISQTLRDARAGYSPIAITPEQIVQQARARAAATLASSYNEPLITSEWALAVFRAGRAAGLPGLYVSNGNATREVLEYLRPYVTAYKIDLKTMRAEGYRRLGAVLEHILDGIRLVHALGFWLEIVTLVVPGLNDDEDELRDAARFIASLSPDIPWHVTAFHADYKMADSEQTGVRKLRRAAEIGLEQGLRYVYAGNLPGQLAPFEDTRCPTCQMTLIQRLGFMVRANRLTADGRCPRCGTAIPGLWRPDHVAFDHAPTACGC